MNNKWETLALQWLDNALKALKSDAELVSSGEIITGQLLTEAKASAARIAELGAENSFYKSWWDTCAKRQDSDVLKAMLIKLEAEVKTLTSERDAFKEELFTDHLKETMNKCTELQVDNFSLKADCKVMAEYVLSTHNPLIKFINGRWRKEFCTCPACTIAAKYREGK